MWGISRSQTSDEDGRYFDIGCGPDHFSSHQTKAAIWQPEGSRTIAQKALSARYVCVVYRQRFYQKIAHTIRAATTHDRMIHTIRPLGR